MKGRRIIASSSAAPFVGNGKLTDYKKDGSWIMNQMEKGYDKVDRGIAVSDESGNIRFARRCSKIAAKITANCCDSINVVKCFKQLPLKDNYEYLFALKWTLRCGIESATVYELNSLNDLLNAFVGEDQEKLNGCSCCFDTFSGGAIDFKNGDIKFECLAHFPATAIVDAERIADTLKKMGFAPCVENAVQQPVNEQPKGEQENV